MQMPLTHMIVTFVLYTTVQNQRLTASVVFSAIAGFNMLRNAMDTLIDEVPILIQAYVSIGRIQDFLNDVELLDQYSIRNMHVLDSSTEHKERVMSHGHHQADCSAVVHKTFSQSKGCWCIWSCK
jgi:hypothetical protein